MSRYFTETFTAVESLSTHQHKVVVNSTNGVGRTGTAGARCDGIVINKPNVNEHATVVVLGRTRVFAGGTIAIGDEISCTASGTVAKTTSGQYILGHAITAVASGGLFLGEITHAGYKG